MSNDKIAKYIEENYYDEIYAAVKAEYENQSSILDMHTFKVPYPETAWLKQIVVSNVHFKDDLSSEITQFSLRVVGVFEVSATLENYDTVDNVYKDFIVNGTCKIYDGLKNVEIGAAEYNLHHCTPDNQSLSYMMLPYISDFEAEATRFLLKYQPQALIEPMHVNVEDIANQMGVIVYQAPFKRNIFGKAYFTDGREKVYNEDNEIVEIDVHRKTILINPDLYFLRSLGSYYYTFVHEIIHIEYHARFYDLHRMVEPDDLSIDCRDARTPKRLNTYFKKAFDIMEYQANTLAAKILLPKEMFLKKYEMLCGEVDHEYPNHNRQNKLDVVIGKLALFFKVSYTVVKFRLIELGYSSAAGVNNYINEKKVPNIRIHDGNLAENESYIISFDNLIDEIKNNEVFGSLFKQGKLVYHKGLVVINSPEYIYKNKNTNKYELTQEALNHIEDCAVKFSRPPVVNANYGETYDNLYFCCNIEGTKGKNSVKGKADPQVNRIIYQHARSLSDTLEERSEAKEFIRNNLNQGYPKDFETAFRYYDSKIGSVYIKSDGSINCSAIKRNLNNRVDDHTIKDYFDGSLKSGVYNKKIIIAICVLVEMHYLVINNILSKKGMNLEASLQAEDEIYMTVLKDYYDQGLDEINEQLRNAEHSNLVLP